MYLNLKRVEFIVTYNCTSKCKHCAVGDKKLHTGGNLCYEKMRRVLTRICEHYHIESIMCFGGEPLLYSNDVVGIMKEARDSNIPKRQIITNGYFSKDKSKIKDVVHSLEKAGVNDILLSVDAFHQEFVPLELIVEFATRVKEGNIINMRIHPAWVINKNNDNKWNEKTNEILSQFINFGISISSGNSISLEGNAIKHLSDYYEKEILNLNFYCGEALYTTKLDDVETISIMPNGDLCVCCFPIGNIYNEDVISILNNYDPNRIPMMKLLLDQGVKGIVDYAEKQGILLDMSKHYSPCSVCKDIVSKSCI